MNFLGCSGALTIDPDGNPICDETWITLTEIELNQLLNSHGMTIEQYQMLVAASALVLTLAFIYKLIVKTLLNH